MWDQTYTSSKNQCKHTCSGIMRCLLLEWAGRNIDEMSGQVCIMDMCEWSLGSGHLVRRGCESSQLENSSMSIWLSGIVPRHRSFLSNGCFTCCAPLPGMQMLLRMDADGGSNPSQKATPCPCCKFDEATLKGTSAGKLRGCCGMEFDREKAEFDREKAVADASRCSGTAVCNGAK